MKNPLHFYLLTLAILLVLGGGLIAFGTQTDGGTIEVREVEFMGLNRTMMSGKLYIPRGVSSENPAPGILAIHGYINSRETQDGFAIEYARRGYVVLALDQTGHGYSDPPAFANGFGGPDGLYYLRSLGFVDPDNIGLEGHSMGGWAALIAADTFPDDYRSIVLAGSSTGVFGAPEGTTTFPRNLGLIFSRWDEFSQLMWGAEPPPQIVFTDKLQTVFGTDEPVVVGQLYGSIEDGTARRLYMPPVTHPGDHLSQVAIAQAMEWMNMTLEGGRRLAPTDQIWYWKEIGTLIGLVGMILFLFPMGALLLEHPYFRPIQGPLPPVRAATGLGWWVSAAILLAVPILTYFWLQNLGTALIPANVVWPQEITNGIMFWAVGNGLIALVLFLLWHRTVNVRKNPEVTPGDYGLTWRDRFGRSRFDWGKVGRAFLLALLIIVPAYLLLALVDWIFTVDFRFWVVAVKLLTIQRFGMFLAYLLPFLFFFLVLETVLHGQLRRAAPNGEAVNLDQAMLTSFILLVGGFFILLLVQYIPLINGGTLLIDEPLLTIVAFQFLALLSIVALVSTYFYRKTGTIYVGAFLNAMLVTWIIVASQATHVPV